MFENHPSSSFHWVVVWNEKTKVRTFPFQAPDSYSIDLRKELYNVRQVKSLRSLQFRVLNEPFLDRGVWFQFALLLRVDPEIDDRWVVEDSSTVTLQGGLRTSVRSILLITTSFVGQILRSKSLWSFGRCFGKKKKKTFLLIWEIPEDKEFDTWEK